VIVHPRWDVQTTPRSSPSPHLHRSPLRRSRLPAPPPTPPRYRVQRRPLAPVRRSSHRTASRRFHRHLPQAPRRERRLPVLNLTSAALKVFLALDPCDMRKSFNGLNTLTSEQLQAAPASPEVTLPVFLFIQRIYQIEKQTRQTAASPSPANSKRSSSSSIKPNVPPATLPKPSATLSTSGIKSSTALVREYSKSTPTSSRT